MKHLLLIIFCLLKPFCVAAQDHAILQRKIPTLSYTEVLANKPANFSLENKYKLVEFWATWCAPCLAAVPELNKLVDTYKSRTDLVFLSVTDQTASEVASTLKRVPFKSIVLSDPSRQSHRLLGVEQNGVMSIPQTFLLDKDNVVRWAGHPQKLTDKLIDQLLADKLNSKSGQEIPEVASEEKPGVEQLFRTLYEDSLVTHLFAVAKPEKRSTNFTSMQSIPMGLMLEINTQLSLLLAKLNRTVPSRIQLPDHLKGARYHVIYKNADARKYAEQGDMDKVLGEFETVKNNLLNALKIKESRQQKETEKFNLKVISEGKLEESKATDEVSHISSQKNTYLFSNVTLEGLGKALSTYTQRSIEYKGSDNRRYNFVFTWQNDWSFLANELSKYGIGMEKKVEAEEVFIYLLRP